EVREAGFPSRDPVGGDIGAGAGVPADDTAGRPGGPRHGHRRRNRGSRLRRGGARGAVVPARAGDGGAAGQGHRVTV
ncbi:MAG: hypothetical protein AVDCRST_MAG64-4070, partial [uncultured Phycisphaerae bacterium]